MITTHEIEAILITVKAYVAAIQHKARLLAQAVFDMLMFVDKFVIHALKNECNNEDCQYCFITQDTVQRWEMATTVVVILSAGLICGLA